jgi:hypothetical protein
MSSHGKHGAAAASGRHGYGDIRTKGWDTTRYDGIGYLE